MSIQRNMAYKPYNLGDITSLSNEDWLKWRDHGPFYANPDHPNYIPIAFGGSDVAAIFNVSPWTSSLELYHKKIGVSPVVEKKKNQDILDSGHMLEPYVAHMFKRYMVEKLGYKESEVEMIEDNNMYQSGEIEVDEEGFEVYDEETGEVKLRYPFAVGNFDGRCKVKKKMAGWEAKTTSSRNYDTIKNWQAGIVPEYYELQCRYYMAIANLDEWWITCVWGFTINEVAVICIKRDLEIEETIMETVKEFANCCLTKTEPDITDCKAELINDYYNRLYGLRETSAPVVELDPDEYGDVVKEALQLDELIVAREKAYHDAEARREEVYKKLYNVYGESSCGSCLIDGNLYYITLSQPTTRATLDLERLQKEEPALFAEYEKITPAINTEKFKKECPVKYKQYLKPQTLSTTSTKKPSFSIKKRELETKTS